MTVSCVWEHHGDDTLLWAVSFPGACTRGEALAIAMAKMEGELRSFAAWAGLPVPDSTEIAVVQESACQLQVWDADSDVLFDTETLPLTEAEYLRQKALVLKSAEDFLSLYDSIPDKHCANRPMRRTFYGKVPRTAEEMYLHTKQVNAYYFGEIGVEADNAGDILISRRRGFVRLEQQRGFLDNSVVQGSYGEAWTLRKVLRRFLWHDRIHAKAMYRLGQSGAVDPFCFSALR